MAMDLPSFIKSIGVDEAAKLFDESRRAVESWRDGERIPRPRTAKKIVERAKGKVTLSSIYGASQ